MNFLSLLAELAEADPELLQRLSPRRGALEHLSRLGGKAAVATVPLALGSMLRGAYAGSQVTVADTLTLAYTLEQLENTFYARALGLATSATPVSATLIPATLRPGISTIQTHEQQHITFLTSVIQASGIALPGALRFDFTGSKNGTQPALFGDVFTNFDTFLIVAQLLEDTGVRAYKGQLIALKDNAATLEAALRIHSVEARHAAHIRSLRRARNADVKPWVNITDQNITVAGKTDAVYAGEDNLTQKVTGKVAVPFRTLPIDKAGLGETSILAKVAQSFDEPMTDTTATQLASLFIY